MTDDTVRPRILIIEDDADAMLEVFVQPVCWWRLEDVEQAQQ